MLWLELFTTDIGLLSLFTIAFVIGMAVFFIWYVRSHIASETAAAQHHSPLAH